jgi:hypothetical protein
MLICGCAYGIGRLYGWCAQSSLNNEVHDANLEFFMAVKILVRVHIVSSLDVKKIYDFESWPQKIMKPIIIS